jgi:hypothetical protein
MNRPRSLFTVALLSITSIGSLAAPARAAAPEEVVDQAKAHFRRGVTLYAEQDFRAALIEFRRAYEISPSWGVLFNIGQTSFELLDYAGALKSLERYLTEGGAAVPAARRTTVEKEIIDLRERVSTLSVRANVDGADIAIDDEIVARTPLAAPLLVSAGRRKITVTKAGRVTAVRMLDLAGRDHADLALDLPEVTAPAAPIIVRSDDRAPSPSAAPAPSRGASPLTVGTFALAVVGAAAGTTFGILALSEKSELDRACPDRACDPSAQHRIDLLKRDATVSTVAFAAGAAGLAVGVLSIVWAPRSREAAHVEAWVAPQSAGLRGAF